MTMNQQALYVLVGAQGQATLKDECSADLVISTAGPSKRSPRERGVTSPPIGRPESHLPLAKSDTSENSATAKNGVTGSSLTVRSRSVERSMATMLEADTAALPELNTPTLSQINTKHTNTNKLVATVGASTAGNAWRRRQRQNWVGSALQSIPCVVVHRAGISVNHKDKPKLAPTQALVKVCAKDLRAMARCTQHNMLGKPGIDIVH
jgi:hypothetical protein